MREKDKTSLHMQVGHGKLNKIYDSDNPFILEENVGLMLQWSVTRNQRSARDLSLLIG